MNMLVCFNVGRAVKVLGLVLAITLPMSSFGESEPQQAGSPLQARIEKAAPGEVIELDSATLAGPILINKPLTLRGKGMDKTVIELLGNEPAVMIRATGGVRLEDLTVRWSLKPTDAQPSHPAAVAVRDATATLERVALAPVDRPQQTPYGLLAVGRTAVTFVKGRSSGFAYALIYMDGACGRVLDSRLEGATHSVVTIHPDSRVEISRNVLARCGYHAVRNTGGTMEMHDNIVMDCTRAGAYLGNRNAHGMIRNNLFSGNCGEIWGYYGSDVTIENNLFYRSKDPAIIFWNTCGLKAHKNSFVGSPGALRQYVKDDRTNQTGITLDGNHYWHNGEDMQAGFVVGSAERRDPRFQLKEPATALSGDPKFSNPAVGDFTPQDGSALRRGGDIVAGLSDPQIIHEIARAAGLQFDPL